MSKITQKEYKQEFMEIKKYFDLDFFGTIENKNSIDTKWGLYKFYFDKNSIFGKFEDYKMAINDFYKKVAIYNLPFQIQFINYLTVKGF